MFDKGRTHVVAEECCREAIRHLAANVHTHTPCLEAVHIIPNAVDMLSQSYMYVPLGFPILKTKLHPSLQICNLY